MFWIFSSQSPYYQGTKKTTNGFQSLRILTTFWQSFNPHFWWLLCTISVSETFNRENALFWYHENTPIQTHCAGWCLIIPISIKKYNLLSNNNSTVVYSKNYPHLSLIVRNWEKQKQNYSWWLYIYIYIYPLFDKSITQNSWRNIISALKCPCVGITHFGTYPKLIIILMLVKYYICICILYIYIYRYIIISYPIISINCQSWKCHLWMHIYICLYMYMYVYVYVYNVYI